MMWWISEKMYIWGGGGRVDFLFFCVCGKICWWRYFVLVFGKVIMGKWIIGWRKFEVKSFKMFYNRVCLFFLVYNESIFMELYFYSLIWWN